MRILVIVGAGYMLVVIIVSNF